MTESSRLVQRSAHEQRDASTAIGTTTTIEGIAEMGKVIAQAAKQQARETRAIVAVMETIRRTAEVAAATATGMNRVVEALAQDAAILGTAGGHDPRDAARLLRARVRRFASGCPGRSCLTQRGAPLGRHGPIHPGGPGPSGADGCRLAALSSLTV